MTSKRWNLKWTNHISVKEKTRKSNMLPLCVDRKRTAMDLAMNTASADKRSGLTERGKAKNSFSATHITNCAKASMTKSSVPLVKIKSRSR